MNTEPRHAKPWKPYFRYVDSFYRDIPARDTPPKHRGQATK